MSKTIYFIGDNHVLDGCIETGLGILKSKYAIKIPGEQYVLLLEVDETTSRIVTTSGSRLRGIIKTISDSAIFPIIEEKGSKDRDALDILIKNSEYRVYGFDIDTGTFDSVSRQNSQRKKIAHYVTENEDTKGYSTFIVIVGAAHLEAIKTGWEPLQNNITGKDSYGENTETKVVCKF